MRKPVKPAIPSALEFREIDSLQDYYFDGENSYSVARLIDASKDLIPFDLPIAGIYLNFEIWRDSNIFGLAFHVKRCMEADLTKPIILDWNGSIADGRHRLIRAIAEGRPTIKAVRITWTMTPDKTTEKPAE